jgi:hypothetical protein
MSEIAKIEKLIRVLKSGQMLQFMSVEAVQEAIKRNEEKLIQLTSQLTE